MRQQRNKGTRQHVNNTNDICVWRKNGCIYENENIFSSKYTTVLHISETEISPFDLIFSCLKRG